MTQSYNFLMPENQISSNDCLNYIIALHFLLQDREQFSSAFNIFFESK